MSIIHPYSEAEFEAIVRKHLPLFHGMALRILKNVADADDAVQMALLRGWRRCFLLRTPDKLVGWLGRIVVNESYTILRRQRREATVSESTVPVMEVPQEAESNRTAETEVQLQKLEKAIAELPELYRQTIHIAILSNLETEAAASLLGCSVNTLYQRIHKAKQLLREALKDE